MNKALLSVTDDTVTIGIPLSKSNINVEKRIVSGWATIDNVDQMGDEVTAEASLEAFSTFRGNVREMHENIAVGKILHFKHQKFYDESGEERNGIYVDVYVSKGAESTWQKVLDGTLNAFSIQGPILPGGKRSEFRKALNRLVNVISKYKLHEISLVDNPGNELCNIISIQKINDEVSAEGIAVDVTLKNVFWCEKDEVAIVSKEVSENCHECHGEMNNTGWFEVVDGEDESESVRKILEDSRKISNENLEIVKGGPVMSEKVENVTAVVEEDKVEKSAEQVDKVTEPNLELITKAMAEIKETLDGLNKNGEGQDNALNEIQKTITGVKDNVEKSLSDLQAKHEELSKRFEEFKAGLEDVTKRLDTVESGEAIQKSLDVDSVEKKESTKQSFWSSTFLPTEKFD